MMTFSQIIAVAAAGIVAAALLSTAPAGAQSTAENGASKAAPGKTQLVIDRDKFDAFIDVAVSVKRIRDAWMPKIRAAETRIEAEQMVASARLEMKQAVENASGISVGEFAAIARAAHQSPQLAQAIERRMRDVEHLDK